jgi:hypothetical protein
MDSWAKQMEEMQKKAAEKLQKKAAEASSAWGMLVAQGSSPDDAAGEEAGAGAEKPGADPAQSSREGSLSSKNSPHLVLPAGPAASTTPAMHALTGTSTAPSPFTSHESSTNHSASGCGASGCGGSSSTSPVDAEGVDSPPAIRGRQPPGTIRAMQPCCCGGFLTLRRGGRQDRSLTHDKQQ